MFEIFKILDQVKSTNNIVKDDATSLMCSLAKNSKDLDRIQKVTDEIIKILCNYILLKY
jgi:hypothetical protein